MLYWSSIFKTTFLTGGEKKKDMNMGKENTMIALNALSNIYPEGLGYWKCVCQIGSFYWSSGNES